LLCSNGIADFRCEAVEKVLHVVFMSSFHSFEHFRVLVANVHQIALPVLFNQPDLSQLLLKQDGCRVELNTRTAEPSSVKLPLSRATKCLRS
jgi:hypothetical protein